MLSGAKVMHNGQWVCLNEWGRAVAALRVRPEAIEIRGGLCVLSTKTMVDTMKKQGMYDCDHCGMPVEEWFKKALNRGEFGTSDWVAPADGPLSALAMQLSRDALGWSGGDDFCLACRAAAEYLHLFAADGIPEEFLCFCCRFAGRHVPKPGLWHEMLPEALGQVDEWEMEYKREPEEDEVDVGLDAVDLALPPEAVDLVLLDRTGGGGLRCSQHSYYSYR